MSVFHSSPAPFSIAEDRQSVFVENQYIRCRHDIATGGMLTETVIRNGSGNNLFARPQSLGIGLVEGAAYHMFRPRCTAWNSSTCNDRILLTFQNILADSAGRILEGLHLTLTIEYSPWGELICRALFHPERRIGQLGTIQMLMFPSETMDMLGVQDCLQTDSYPRGCGSRVHWHPLSRSNHRLYRSRWLSQSLLFLRRGVEGFQIMAGDHRESWAQGSGILPGFQAAEVAWNQTAGAYTMEYSPLDSLRSGQFLQNDLTFEFYLSFPFVRRNMTPLSPCSGHILKKEKGFNLRWPDDEDLQKLQNAGTSLMRFHNDGDIYDNGIFWRSGTYPPYPPGEMEKLDELLARAHACGIAVTPYFSLHELHPDAPVFQQNAQHWGRLIHPQDDLLPNYAPHGLYGCQMCLNSGWFDERIRTIDETLKHHDFDGVYYDWCMGAECVNPEHGFWHRDYRRLMELLEWSHRRIGPAGALYLHLTGTPNLPAENMASLILTEEFNSPIINPEMFTPQAHFLNIAPRQVCCMLSPDAPAEDYRRYALCAILHHATVSSAAPPVTAFHAEYRSLLNSTAAFQHHSAPGEGLCFTENPRTGISAYWNSSGAWMLFLANLSDREENTEYTFCQPNFTQSDKIRLSPLSLTAVSGQIPNP